MNNNIPVNNNDSVNAVAQNSSNMNFIKRVFGVIGYPEKVMQSLEQKPRVLFGILLTALTPIILILSTYSIYMEYLRKVLEATYAKMDIEMTAQQIDQTLNISKYSSLIGGPIGAVALLLLEALVLWVIIKIFKGQGGYKQILSIIGYSAVITLLSTIVTIITTRITGTFTDVSYTSLAALLPNMKGSFLYGVAKMIEIFTIWQYIVIAIGLTTVSKLSKKKVYIIVACLFVAVAIYSGVTAGAAV